MYLQEAGKETVGPPKHSGKSTEWVSWVAVFHTVYTADHYKHSTNLVHLHAKDTSGIRLNKNVATHALWYKLELRIKQSENKTKHALLYMYTSAFRKHVNMIAYVCMLRTCYLNCYVRQHLPTDWMTLPIQTLFTWNKQIFSQWPNILCTELEKMNIIVPNFLRITIGGCSAIYWLTSCSYLSKYVMSSL